MTETLVGAHLSIAGGVHNALLRGNDIGATTIQIFTSNQKQWHGKPIPQDEVERWQKAKENTKITKVMSHDSYLINLGSPKEDLLLKSRNAFLEELERCHALEIDFLNFHPGTATDDDIEGCLKRISESLLSFAPLANKGNTTLLIETTAGQGRTVGHLFSHLNTIIKGVKGKVPIGVCIDTCHIFAAGYDIRDQKGWDTVLKEFDKVVGLKYLKALHLNDSLKPLGSRVDRHAPLGEGEIGLDSFKVVMQDPRLALLPKYLETPRTEKWAEEIALLKDFAK